MTLPATPSGGSVDVPLSKQLTCCRERSQCRLVQQVVFWQNRFELAVRLTPEVKYQLCHSTLSIV